MMKKLIVLLALCGGVLAGCAAPEHSPYSNSYDGQQRSVVGDFCPPKQAIKGNC